MKRLLFRSLIVLGALLAAGAAIIYWLVASSLPQLDGGITSAGLKATVSIERDAAGIPTITARNRLDLAFASGYVHGQDRFFQMDLSRRRAAGELAQLFGEGALGFDRRTRLHRFRSRARAVIENSTEADVALLDAYAAGVNAGLDGLGARPFEYFILQSKPQPWTSEDCILVGYAMFLTLNDERARRDVQRGLAHRILPPQVYHWMYPHGTEWDAPMQGDARPHAEIPGPDVYDLRDSTRASGTAASTGPTGELPVGSNNWAVSGDLTQNGRAIVANDMHLDLATPNIFYRARLVVDGPDPRDVTGLTLPGTPVMVVGSNGKVAWAFTNSYGDWSDAVVIVPGALPQTYLTPDGTYEIQRITETIQVKHAEPQQLLVRETIWGPILDDVVWPEGEIAVSWIAHSPAAITLAQLGLETAGSVTEALEVANEIGIPPQNFVAGDADGNIGWTIAGRIPVRSGFDPWLPADWSKTHGWSGWIDPDRYPRIVNPESGRIWTANARVVDSEALSIIGDGGYALGARALQIRDSLFASDSFVPADMLAVQIDDRALFLERWQDLLLSVLDDAAIDGYPQRAEYRRLIQNWIPRASVDSVGYRLVRDFRNETQKSVFEMLAAPVRAAYADDVKLRISNQFEAPLWQLLGQQPAHLLSADYASWRDLMLQAVDDSILRYAERFDGGLADRSWGERNTAAIRHPLSYFLPALSAWLDMPAEPLNGDAKMPRAQGPSFGASERFGVSPGDEANGYLHMPAGQSGHPLSNYFRVGHDDWVQARPSNFLPGATEHRLTLIP